MTSRSSLCGLILLALLIIAPTATAQFTILSSSPSNGALVLPGNVNLCLTFNAVLDTTQRWNFNEDEWDQAPVDFIIAAPADDVWLSDWSWNSADLTLCLSLWLSDETDYFFLISMAQDLQGHGLAAPFELHVSTASSWGVRTVSGNLTRSDGGSTVGAVAALFDDTPFGYDLTNMSAGSAVNGAEGAYNIPHVRSGWYFPVGAQDLNGDGIIDPTHGDLFAFYDPDGDGQPDSVLVSTTNQSNIDMTLDLIGQVRARDGLEAARQAAVTIAPDAGLEAVLSTGESVDNEGRSFGWLYHFYSSQQMQSIDVYYTGLLTDVSVSDSSFWPQMATLDPDYMDSDAALSIALAAGGATFEESLVERYRSMFVGNLYWPQEPEACLWFVNLAGSDLDGNWQDFEVVLDALTGEVYFAQSDLPDSRPDMQPVAFALGTPWPNPFNPSLRIPFELDHAQDLRLAVYNLDGQLVIELARGAWAAGHHELIFDGSSIASGLYLVVLEAEGRCEARKIALMK